MHWMLLPLKRYAEFSGRSRRKEYWLFFLGVVLLYLVLVLLMVALMGGAILSALGSVDGTGAIDADGAAAGAGMMGAMLGGGIIGILIVIAWLVLLVPSIAVGVRRLHDIDRSGWWLMLGYGPYLLGIAFAMAESETLAGIANLVSMIGFIVLLVFAVLPGTRGSNRFGADPKGEDLSQVFA